MCVCVCLRVLLLLISVLSAFAFSELLLLWSQRKQFIKEKQFTNKQNTPHFVPTHGSKWIFCLNVQLNDVWCSVIVELSSRLCAWVLLTFTNWGNSAKVAITSDPLLSRRHDEPPSHPHQWAGRAHWAAESQRQPATISGVRGKMLHVDSLFHTSTLIVQRR